MQGLRALRAGLLSTCIFYLIYMQGLRALLAGLLSSRLQAQNVLALRICRFIKSLYAATAHGE
jgi:hypothetical protein